MSGEHLISDEETRTIAEGFLSVSPWLGDVEWARTVLGPHAEFLVGFDGKIPENATLSDDQRWSWTVSFSDPAGRRSTLNHEVVLGGLTRLVYDKDTGSDIYLSLPISQWFTEPSETRRSLRLSASQQSLICQHALYEKTVFPTGEREELFGKKLDFFSDQRPDTASSSEA
ncbi:hypothetical protein ACFVXG_38530 [Kitasatospora sp. NPDC058162]|uniref:hypothetical protein n=1 Tax=Kitasatospora sp. NPDC058162 TaxID=3346362 RepID=UPI0036DF9C3D